MSRPAPRLKDIAERTGVSINTVSVALRGGSHLPEATRARIVAAARELNYVPNAVARSLVRRSTQTIGVVLTNLMNPSQMRAAQAIEAGLMAAGYGALMTVSRNELDRERQAIDHLLGRQVDGILIYPADHARLEHLAAVGAAGVPLVLLVRVPPDAGFDVVALDDRRGAAMMTRHLIELGHRDIAFLDGGQAHGSLEKLTGYREALDATGLPFAPARVAATRGNAAVDGYGAMPALMSGNRPTAVFASSDSLAIGALRWCREHGVRVPDDLSLAGFDDIEAAAFLDVPLTTVSYRADQVGTAAVARIVELAAADPAGRTPGARVIEPRLVLRQSSATKPARTGGTP